MIPKLVLTLFSVVCMVMGQTGEEILRRMDKNRSFTTISYTATMTIYIDGKIRIKTMNAQALIFPENKALVKFTNPEDEGTRYLKIKDDLWMYFPQEEEVVKISGHMLKDGMMGSDVSYEDALESKTLSQKYTITLIGTENFNHHACYLVDLTARVTDVSYYKRKMWVDTNTFIPLKEELYATSGKLLKYSQTLDIKIIDTKAIATKVEMVNALRKNSKTVFEMNSIVLDKFIDPSLFTMRNLKK